VAEVMFRNVRTIRTREDASRLLAIFSEGLVGLVVDDQEKLVGIVTKMDLVDVLTSRQARQEA